MIGITADNKLKRLIVVGDRVLIKPKDPPTAHPAAYIYRQRCRKKKKSGRAM